MQTRLRQLRNRYFRHVKSEFAFRYFAILGACDAAVTGDGRNQYIWKGIVSNSIFPETASDALRSNYVHWRVAHFYAVKIRRLSAVFFLHEKLRLFEWGVLLFSTLGAVLISVSKTSEGPQPSI
jgi:hypothetical protein